MPARQAIQGRVGAVLHRRVQPVLPHADPGACAGGRRRGRELVLRVFPEKLRGWRDHRLGVRGSGHVPVQRGAGVGEAERRFVARRIESHI